MTLNSEPFVIPVSKAFVTSNEVLKQAPHVGV